MRLKKKLILDKSRRLFNEGGLANVTMRQIALGMKMSPGNLTYHYSKRKDIISALVEELSFGELAFLEMYLSPKQTKAQLERLIYNHTKVLIDYRFLWVDYLQLEREDPILKKQIDRIMNQRRIYLDTDLANYLNEFLYQMAIDNHEFTNYGFTAIYNSLIDKLGTKNVSV